MGEQLDAMKNQRKIMSEIIAKECNKNIKDVEQDMVNGIILNHQKAIEYGLVTEIKDELIPKGINFININL